MQRHTMGIYLITCGSATLEGRLLCHFKGET